MASNATFDLNGHSQVISNLLLNVGPLGGGVVNVGTGGTLAVVASAPSSPGPNAITVHTLGSGNPSGAAITGGTLALNTFN